MIPLTATIKDDVYERYISGRDSTLPDVSFWACVFDSLRGKSYNVIAIEKTTDGRKLVTLDMKELGIIFKETKVEFVTVEEELVDYPANIGVIEMRR